MANKTSRPNDAPVVQVETTGVFGQPVVKQISLDTNRLNVKAESLQRFANMVAIPSRGLFLDAVTWVTAVAVLLRLPLSFAIAYGSLQLLGWAWGLLALCASFPLVVVYLQVPDLRPDCFYRFCMISGGFAVATQFVWISQWWPL